MRSLIAVLLLLFVSQVHANKWPIWPQIQAAHGNLGWQIDQNKIIGHKTRVPLYGGQDPFPFCAAVAASILHDQHECMGGKKDCSTQVRTSPLSLVAASQGTTNTINWDNGGNSISALAHIIKNGGAAEYSKCNYGSITEPRKNKGADLSRIYGNYANYRQFRKWPGYLQRYHRDEFIWEITQLGLYRNNIESILEQQIKTPHELATSILLQDSCSRVDIQSSKKYKINTLDNPDQKIEAVYKKIQNLLENGTPVGVNTCLNVDVGLKTCSKHSLVVFAEGTAANRITGDIRRVYRIANTWSEEWHRDHADGWIFADQLLLGIYSLFWLE